MAELDSTPKSVQTLYGWYSQNRLFVNRRYQRKLVWTLEEKQRLIESLMKRYPVPAIILAERPSDGNYEIIDGLQRLHSIVSFIENSFTTTDGKYFDVAQFPTAKDRLDKGQFLVPEDPLTTSAEEVSLILDYTLAISVMRGSEDDEIDDVFGRINTYGHQLSDQERRQAGVQDQFSALVRTLACNLRGDASDDVLTLGDMPSISVDLPMTKHGYGIKADEIFWVQQGILRSTDLRDSLDEQCLADIASCIVGGKLIERSKDALDRVYNGAEPENARIESALQVYGADKLIAEIKHCINELLVTMAAGTPQKMKKVIFEKQNANGFPATFATIVIAVHESLIGEKKKIADHAGLRTSLNNLNKHIDTGKGSTATLKRRRNIDSVKGIISSNLIASDLKEVYGSNTAIDIDNMIRRSQAETASYELKQGILRLDSDRNIDPSIFDKVIRTVCAISNIGPHHSGGAVIVGVADDDKDSARIKTLDGISPILKGWRNIVGIQREVRILGETTEEYFARWKNAIRNSGLSSPLKDDVLSRIDYHDYFGLGLVVISVPRQSDLSYVGDETYTRESDETVHVTGAKSIADLAKRFA
ncbi:DUF262 domain-containing protein [Rhodococcoides fascians]|uniref:DUF262 domain-containing protein n=1 Tax=Rhodococcoides fascians TaxID=1828 RepID=UPI00050CBA41|nr:DUF262 domain-containing protein [Rhodococcus fascians]